MSTLLTIPDAAELLAHTLTALKAAGYASAAMIPAHKNTSNEGEKTEVLHPATAPEVYVAPGKQYANAREALAHMVFELKNPQRDNYNETLDFTFASLAQLLDIIREPVYQHGLLLKQEFEKGNELPLDMVTTFIHIPTDTEISFRLPASIKEDKRLDECQKVGATFTYYRRYGLRQALDITDGDDDIDQADAKRERRKARALNSTRKWKPATSSRTAAESILNILVASGEFAGKAAILQAKSRNQFLRTPDEVADDSIRYGADIGDEEAIARDTVLRYGLTDAHWQQFFKEAGVFQVDGDDLIDTRTGKPVSADIAMDVAESLASIALSTADNNDVRDSRDTSRPVAPGFIPDCSAVDSDEEAFIAAVETGHFDEIAEIAERQTDAHIAYGLDLRTVRENKDYQHYFRRNWYNACREFYTLALMRGDVNFDVLAKPDITVTTPAPVIDMQQLVDLAREITTGNSETPVKLQQLSEIAQRCDAYTANYIDTLKMHVECDGLNDDLPAYIPESELPY